MKGASLVWGVAGSTPPASPCIVASMDHPVEHMSLDQAREHGWCGGTHRVVCTHIAQLTREALSWVNRVDQAVFPAPAPGGEVMGARNALVCMERAINHLEHAAQELRDEFLRLRDGWET
jgi:hypothetical protein